MILSIHDLGARRGLIFHATNRLIYSRIKLGTGSTGGWGEGGATFLDGYGKSRSHQSLNPETSSSD